MLRKLPFALVVGTLVSGCGVGGGGGGGDDQQPPQDTNEQSITCTAQLTLAGTFTAPIALDPLGGCQPEGTWVVTATVSDKGTCANVPLKSSYTYTLTGIGRTSNVTYTTATGEEFQGAVSASGDGFCVGAFEHILPDGTSFDHFNMRPTLPKPTAATTFTIGGIGEFELWSRHP